MVTSRGSHTPEAARGRRALLPREEVVPVSLWVRPGAAAVGRAVGAGAPWARAGCLSWDELEVRQGLCPWGLTQLLLRIRSASQFQIPLLW